MKKAREFFWPDRVTICVEGRGVESFLTAVAANKVHLRKVRRTEEGIVAEAAGREFAQLTKIAHRGGWNLTIRRRFGPGRILEGVARRPGLAVGLVLFAVLCQTFGGTLWHIDFGQIEETQTRQKLLGQLREHGIWEGAAITQPLLAKAQTELMAQTEEFGWLSLNFQDGCLFVEQTPIQRQGQKPAPTDTALVASDDAYVLSIDLESGFSMVHPEQTVKKGQLLVDGQRPDRDGDAVVQPARGRVFAKVIKSYEAYWPFEKVVANSPTGRTAQQNVWQCGQFYSRQVYTDTKEIPFTHYLCLQEYAPLQLGRIALPACLTHRFYVETARQKYDYEVGQATQLAKRCCCLALRREYPDAVVEEERQTSTEGPEGVKVELCYTFTADIARRGVRPEETTTQETG